MGGKRTYDSAQRAKLTLLRELHDEYMLARRELKARIEEQYRTDLEQYEFRESRLMNELERMGVAKTDIGLAVRLMDWNQLKAKYALTAHEFDQGRAREQAEFEIDLSTIRDTTVHVTLNWVDLAGEVVEGPAVFEAWDDGTPEWDSSIPGSGPIQDAITGFYRSDPEAALKWQSDLHSRVVAKVKEARK